MNDKDPPHSLRRRTHFLLASDSAVPAGRQIDTFIICLIALSILAVILESEATLAAEYETPFLIFEYFSTFIFSVEYLARLWVCVEQPRFRHPFFGRMRYIITPMALVDLLAILPFYLGLFIDTKSVDARFIRGIRLFRLFRLFKIGRYSQSISRLVNVFARKKEELAITFFAVVMLLIFASSVIYLVEHKAQPEQFSSIPAAMWWGVATLTTVGYGDIYPITGLGKFCGAVIALLGVGIVALPAGIIASGFNEAIQERESRPCACPSCGASLVMTEDGLEEAPSAGEENKARP
ncbi:MAG: ion transporter [Myxococcota bacterium]|nr:ion transporter [Myxococcota bacterium]